MNNSRMGYTPAAVTAADAETEAQAWEEGYELIEFGDSTYPFGVPKRVREEWAAACRATPAEEMRARALHLFRWGNFALPDGTHAPTRTEAHHARIKAHQAQLMREAEQQLKHEGARVAGRLQQDSQRANEIAGALKTYREPEKSLSVSASLWAQTVAPAQGASLLGHGLNQQGRSLFLGQAQSAGQDDGRPVPGSYYGG
jgi:hypothetical protein